MSLSPSPAVPLRCVSRGMLVVRQLCSSCSRALLRRASKAKLVRVPLLLSVPQMADGSCGWLRHCQRSTQAHMLQTARAPALQVATRQSCTVAHRSSSGTAAPKAARRCESK